MRWASAVRETLFRLGRFAEVVKAFDRYLEAGKPLESVYRGRGLARAELGQYPGAIEDFTKALELHPTSAVQAYRGWTHLIVDAPKLALATSSWPSSSIPRTATPTTAGVLCARHGPLPRGRRRRGGGDRPWADVSSLALQCRALYAQCPRPYRDRALPLIQKALGLLPAEERRPFWSTHIRSDAALATLRRHPAFIKLYDELPQGK